MYCYGLNLSPPTLQNTYVKIIPKVIVLEGGAFGKCLGHEGIYLTYKRGPRICLPVWEIQETWVQSLGQKIPWWKKWQPRILAWEIPWTG